MHQDATWYGGRPQPRGLCVREGPSTPFPKKEAVPPIFSPCLLWPNGWMDQDVTRHVGRPWSSPHCARWGHRSPPQKRGGAEPPVFGPPLLCPNGWTHQEATWYGDRPQPRRLGVRWGPSPYPKRGGAPPNFRPTSIVAKRLHGSRCHLVWR